MVQRYSIVEAAGSMCGGAATNKRRYYMHTAVRSAAAQQASAGAGLLAAARSRMAARVTDLLGQYAAMYASSSPAATASMSSSPRAVRLARERAADIDAALAALLAEPAAATSLSPIGGSGLDCLMGGLGLSDVWALVLGQGH